MAQSFTDSRLAGMKTGSSSSRQLVAITSGLISPAYCAPTPAASELAGTLKWQHPATPNAERWGLGRLIRVGRERLVQCRPGVAPRAARENRRTLSLTRFRSTYRPLEACDSGRKSSNQTRRRRSDSRHTRQDAPDALDCAFAVRTIEVEREWTTHAGE